MKQLSSLDAQFLALENPRQHGHVGSVAVLDPSTAPDGRLTAASMMDLLRARMHVLPPLRWRLVEVPFGMDYPYWVEDDQFDLSYHVRESALPAPGDDHQLADLISRLHGRGLDRARPLWEMYVISGLASGYVAMYTKIHHSVIDGVSGAEITGLLLDLTPEVRSFPHADAGVPPPRPSSARMWARAVLGLPRAQLRMLRSLPRTIPNLEETTLAGLPGVGRLGRLAGRLGALASGDEHRVIRAAMPAPKPPFSRKLSPHRRIAFGRLELDRVKAVKRAYEVTVNDVVVALCAGAVRRWLLDHKELPDDPLIAQIPVSVRTSEQAGKYGNRILLLAVPLHTEMPDPVARLKATAAGLLEMKGRHQTLPADLLADVNHFIPPVLFSRAAPAILALGTSAVGRPTWNLAVSNVPGPQQPLYCGGARLVANYPVSVIIDGMGLNITVMSYNGDLDIGIVADRDQMPDVWTLLEHLEVSLAELEDALATS